jgi:hypothetical protein
VLPVTLVVLSKKNKMNIRTILLPTLIAVSVFLTGCPISTKYPLCDKTNALPFDATLLGTWRNTAVKEDEGHEAAKIMVSKGSSTNTYRISVKEKREAYAADSDVFDGWITEINGTKFFVLQEVVNGKSMETFYVYLFVPGAGMFTTNDASLKVKGTDAITSIEAYREEMKASMSHPEFHNPKTVWRKL